MKKVYISGAIDSAPGNTDSREDEFSKVEHDLIGMGFIPVNPFKNDVPVTGRHQDHMRADIRLLCDCDMIYMMKGWESSPGAMLEHAVAAAIGCKVLKYE